MSIEQHDVRHLARLAKLALDEPDIPALATELARIVEYVAELAAVDTTGVEPWLPGAVLAAPLRPDTPARGLSAELALDQAPRRRERAFAVPAFVDDE